MLLDLTAAFDMVDHHILLHRLEHFFGFSSTVLSRFKSYLSDRDYFVSIGECSSDKFPVTCGVPQGSILGPLLFNLYIMPLTKLFQNYHIFYHIYADDTQIYVSVSPDDHSRLGSLVQCMKRVGQWMCNNFLQLNEDKTEVIVFGSMKDRESLCDQLNGLSFTCKNQAKSLGVTFDCDLTFNSHIKMISQHFII